jgi:leucyl/phenylalanyl-tRNA--protein transferase
MNLADLLRPQLEQYYPYLEDEKDIKSVPGLLDNSGGEFCFSFTFTKNMISLTCKQGYYPMADMAMGVPLFLVKMHHERCCLFFDNLYISKRTRRYAKGLTVTMDRNFDGVIAGIKKQHDQNWLIPELVTTFRELHHSPAHGISFHSIECYRGDTLVAGDIGFKQGSVFSGISRFHTESSSGSVLLAATARILESSGFHFFDLGMYAGYKKRAGASVVPRSDFFRLYKRAAANESSLKGGSRDAYDLL